MGSDEATEPSSSSPLASKTKRWRRRILDRWTRVLRSYHRGRAPSSSSSSSPSLFLVAVALVLLLGTVMLLIVMVGIWAFRHSQCYSREAGIQWKPAPIIDLSRPCPKPDYTTVTAAAAAAIEPSPSFQQQQYTDKEETEKPRICVTTLTDRQSQSTWQRLLRCRDFDGVAKLTFPNLEAYAHKHGYTVYDASAHVDTSRPPAWSKILAVQALLQRGEEKDDRCDWVFWVDADIVVMESDVRIEDFLPTKESNIDLLITMDRRLTANSGAWLVRNTAWSQEFLQSWWGMRRWVREPGLSLSGDNAAYGHLIEQSLQKPSDATRIRMVPRCTFNSFAVFVPDNTDASKKPSPSLPLEREEWYMSENFYHRGDFMAHASGVDQKEACVGMLLAKAK